jgi:hypothetical protein
MALAWSWDPGGDEGRLDQSMVAPGTALPKGYPPPDLTGQAVASHNKAGWKLAV